MKKNLNILYYLVICIYLVCPLNTWALINENEIYISTNPVKEGKVTTIPSEYAFTPKFISKVTEVEKSNAYISGREDRVGTAASSGELYSLAVRDAVTGYSEYWVKYKNVGKWNRTIVDMKITLEDVIYDTTKTCKLDYDKFPKRDKVTENTKITDIAEIVFHENFIGIEMNKLYSTYRTSDSDTLPYAIFKVQFFDHASGRELTDIKTAITYTDLDLDEVILLNNTRTNELIYFEPYGKEHYDILQNNLNNYTVLAGNSNWTCQRYESNGALGALGQTGECGIDGRVVLGTCYNGNCDGCSKAGMIITLNSGEFTVGWGGLGLSFTSPSFLKIENPKPVKSADKETAKIGEDIHYIIEQYVPNQSSENYYKSWKITDQLDSILKTGVNDIIVTNDNGNNVTDKFDIIVEKNTVTVSAKADYLASNAFYNTTYTIDIKAKVEGNGKNKIINKAILNVKDNDGSIEDIPSDEVTTYIDPGEVVKVPDTRKMINNMLIITGTVILIGGIFVIIRKRQKLSTLNK